MTASDSQWQSWLLYISVPSLVVLLHSVWSSGENDAGSVATSALIFVPAPVPAPAPTLDPPPRTFLDPVWAEWGSAEGQFETLVPPSEIDLGIPRRMPWEQPRRDGGAPDQKCDDILLFMPQMFARNGHGSQLNSYLLAAMVATFLGKAMVILEAPQKYTKYSNGSQFGCPIDAFKNPEEYLNFRADDHSELEMRRDFPRGLERLIVHPRWLSRDCAVPKCHGFNYKSWEGVRLRQRERYAEGQEPLTITCLEGDRSAQVTVMGGEEVRQFFRGSYMDQMLQRSGRKARKRAYDWAARLGATHYQAQVFSSLTEESDIWDYVSGLVARSGLVTFQPWIARDVKAFVEGSRLPLDEPHDAIHVRRGDKVAWEGREEVVNYWHQQGYERQVDFPHNYIPFTHYLRLWETRCDSDWMDGVPIKPKKARTIYVATDDQRTLKEEIAKLPKGQGGTTIVGGCERVNFVFSPDKAQHGSLHINEGGVREDCVHRYQRNIHSIADLMILTKSNTFVGEFTSNWGRLVRTFRTQLNDMYVMPDTSLGWKELLGLAREEDELPKAEGGRPSLVHDTRVAFGEDKALPPPGW